jgi:hypothetical protein
MDMFGPNTNRGRVPLETTRLKLPPVEASDNPTPLKLLGSQAAEAEETDCSKTDLLIQGLRTGCPPNAVWSPRRAREVASHRRERLGLIYKDSAGEQREIGIVFGKQDPAVTRSTARDSVPERG